MDSFSFIDEKLRTPVKTLYDKAFILPRNVYGDR